MTTFDEVRALDRIMRLFWKQGFERTTFEQIVSETGVSRYGLYGVFGEKRRLFHRSLEHYANTVLPEYFAGCDGDDSGVNEIRAAFERLLSSLDDEPAGLGCLLCNSGVEVGAKDTDARTIIRGEWDAVMRWIERALQRARAAGDLKPDTDVKRLAAGLVGLYQSIKILDRAGIPTATRALAELALGFLDDARLQGSR